MSSDEDMEWIIADIQRHLVHNELMTNSNIARLVEMFSQYTHEREDNYFVFDEHKSFMPKSNVSYTLGPYNFSYHHVTSASNSWISAQFSVSHSTNPSQHDIIFTFNNIRELARVKNGTNQTPNSSIKISKSKLIDTMCKDYDINLSILLFVCSILNSFCFGQAITIVPKTSSKLNPMACGYNPSTKKENFFYTNFDLGKVIELLPPPRTQPVADSELENYVVIELDDSSPHMDWIVNGDMWEGLFHTDPFYSYLFNKTFNQVGTPNRCYKFDAQLIKYNIEHISMHEDESLFGITYWFRACDLTHAIYVDGRLIRNVDECIPFVVQFYADPNDSKILPPHSFPLKAQSCSCTTCHVGD